MVLSKEEKNNRAEKRRLIKWQLVHLIIDGQDYKLCSNCNEYKPANNEYYYSNKSNCIDGLNPYCIPCVVEKSLKRIYKNYDKFKEYLRGYDKQPWVREQKTKRGRRYRESEVYQEWVANNAERLAEHQRNRVEHKTHEISSDEWKTCKEYFNHECAYCGMHINSHFIKRKGKIIKSDLHKEHVDHNGSNRIDNCVPSCLTCNSSKHTKELNDWYNEKNKRYNIERRNKIHKWLKEDYRMISK